MTRRICARPGCGEVAVVVLGIDVTRRLAWFDPIDSAGSVAGAGRLCERHARTMVLPQGWFLDDRRVELPQLFSPPGAPPAKPTKPAVAAAPPDDEPAPEPPKPRKPRKKKAPVEPSGPELGDQGSLLAEPPAPEPESAPAPEPPTDIESWSPRFDQADDLNGLLAAQTPLLSRAFGKKRRAG